MRKLLIALLLLTPAATPQRTLSNLVDRNRVLLLFTPSSFDAHYAQQLANLEHHEEDLRARDLVLIPLVQQPGPPNISAVLRAMQPPLVQADEQITFRKRFHVAPNEFTVILLGKDGGEKLRSNLPITVTRLNRLIDAMPMRQQEMRNQH